ncbi:MAG TPA: alpha/beta hydrolase [Burkholderiales bacterium]|nr:alpha/beta hydrolase [Burkholderiales bacterium]
MSAEAQGIAAPPHPAQYTRHHIEIPAGRLHYLDYGSAGGRPMLCLHGGAANGHWFDFVAAGFNRDYHVHALDQRGHGDSAWIEPPAYRYEDYVADLAAVIERLGLDDFVLVGHSMGGMVALAYAATHPGRVAQLVIVDTTMRMSEERLNAMRDVGNRPGRPYASLEDFAERFRLRPPGSLAPPEVIRHIGRNSTRQTASGEWRHKFDRNVYLMRPALDGIPYWSAIRMPALLVKGALSGRLSPQVLTQIRERCPHAEVAEVAASDHHVTLDNPAGFVSAVRDFLARHPD